LLTVVFQGSNTKCPHCAAAAKNGIKVVKSDSVMVVVTEKEARDKAVLGKLPQILQDHLRKQSGGAYVSFTVFDADLTKIIASANRFALEDDKQKTREFKDKNEEAQKQLK